MRPAQIADNELSDARISLLPYLWPSTSLTSRSLACPPPDNREIRILHV